MNVVAATRIVLDLFLAAPETETGIAALRLLAHVLPSDNRVLSPLIAPLFPIVHGMLVKVCIKCCHYN